MFLRCTLRHCPHGLVILVMSTYVDLMALITWSVLKLETRDSDCSCAARRLRQHVLRDWRTGLNVGEWLKTNKNNNLQRVPESTNLWPAFSDLMVLGAPTYTGWGPNAFWHKGQKPWPWVKGQPLRMEPSFGSRSLSLSDIISPSMSLSNLPTIVHCL